VALIALLVLAASLPYLNTLHNGFVYDDTDQILKNPYLQNFHHLREILASEVWSYRAGGAAAGYYRPLMMLLYLVTFQCFGPQPAMFHLINVLFHAAVVVVLFAAARRLFQSRAVALAAAAIFALHPVHSESVNWIAGVTDLELTFFCLLTFCVFLGLSRPRTEQRAEARAPVAPTTLTEAGQFCDTGRAPVTATGFRRGVLAQLGMGASFLLALLSKEPAMTVALLATIYEHFYRDDRAETKWSTKVSRYGLLWVINAVYFVFRLQLLGPPKAMRSAPLDEVLISAVALVGQYVWKFLWPVRLSAFYTSWDELADILPKAGEGLVVLACLAVLFGLLWRKARPVSFGLVWFVVTLAPVLNVRWMPADVFAERYLYLPSVGLCWALGWGCARAFEMTRSRPGRPRSQAAWRVGLAALAALVAALSALRIVMRNRDWHDDVTLYTRTLDTSPDSVQIINNLGQVYYNRGDVKAAEREWLRAEKIAPDYPILLDNLGLLYIREQRYPEAIHALESSLRQGANNPDAHINLAEAYEALGQREQAEAELKSAVALAPFNVRARNRLGELDFAEKRYAEAADQFQRSVESVPNSQAYLGAGLACFQLGRREDAESNFKKAETLDPKDSRPHFVLGVLYGEMGRIADAKREYEAGFKLDPENQEARAAYRRLQAGGGSHQ
jgi:tetratricopeptide (TPR) repeat protein